jgi:hypothetical protein
MNFFATNSTLTWSATVPGGSALSDNALSGLFQSGENNTLNISGVDFGDSGTPGDNPHYDVFALAYEVGSSFRAEDNASFICADHLCGNNADGDDDPSDDSMLHSVGSSLGATITTSLNHFGGTVFKGNNDQTLKEFSHFYYSPSTCTYDYYLLEAMDTDADGDPSDEAWTVLWRNRGVVPGSTGGWRPSGHVGLLLPPTKEDPSGVSRDMYYAPSVAWSCPAGATAARSYLNDYASSTDDLGLGQGWGYLRSSTYDATVPFSVSSTVSVTATQTSASQPDVFVLRVKAIDLQ